MNLPAIIETLASSLALAMGLYLLISPVSSARWRDRSLGGASLAAFLVLAQMAANSLNYLPLVVWTSGLDAVGATAFGPFLFLYVRFATCESFRFRLAHLSHFALSLFLAAIVLASHQMVAYEEQLAIAARHSDKLPSNFVEVLLVGSCYLQLLSYAYLSLRVVWRVPAEKFSALLPRDVHIAFFAIILLSLFATAVIDLTLPGGGAVVGLLYAPTIGLFAAGTIWCRLQYRNSKVATEIVSQTPRIVHENAREGAADTSSSEESGILRETLRRLDVYIDEKELFRDPELTLNRLAERIGCGRSLLSHAINSVHGVNYNRFINSRRVEAAKQDLQDPAQDAISIADIAYKAGFNSLSSFNTVFRDITGETPSAYRRTSRATKSVS